jgi:arylsulfatase A-like enzyme
MPLSFHRTISLIAVVVGILVTVAIGRASAADSLAGKRPNIIFIVTDDQGYGDLSCHGNPILKTPNIDRIHAEGVRFTDFHVSPTCAPTRSALMTGRHEFRNGVTHTILERERLTLKATTLAQVLKSAGYTTGIFGKWHLGDEAEYQPNRRGFDEVFIHGAGGIGQSYPGSCGDAPGNTYFSPAILHNGTFEKTNGYCTDVFFTQATKWIEATKGTQPFYAHIATNAPHGPLQVRPEDEARYADVVSRSPANAVSRSPDLDTRPTAGLPNPTKSGRPAVAGAGGVGRPAPNKANTKKANSHDVAKFFGMIANIDDNVGKLLAKLNEWGIERDTLVIFMNDNGGTVGVPVHNAGMRGSKGTAWLGGTRASSFWRWPGTLKPGDVTKLAAHIDFFPTLADLAGAKLTDDVKAQIEGRSLVPLLDIPQADWPDRTLFTHLGRWPKGDSPETCKFSKCSVRTPRWHLVSDAKPGEKQWQLFDVTNDYGEKTDVAEQQPQVVAELAKSYDAWWESVQPQLVNENVPLAPENPFKTLFDKQFGRTPKSNTK